MTVKSACETSKIASKEYPIAIDPLRTFGWRETVPA